MKKVLITAALLALTASVASAQISLNWSNCIQQSPTNQNRNDACYVCPNIADHRAISSFLAPTTIPTYVGVTTVIDIFLTGTTLPDWWRFDAAGCRANGLVLGLYTGTTPLVCVDGMAGAALNGPILAILNGNKGPNTIRLISDNARSEDFPLTGGLAYVAQQHAITHLKTTVDCDATDPTPVCLGCLTPASIALEEVQLYSRAPAPNDKFVLTAPNVRNFVTLNGGAGVPTPVQNKSWGAVKALYR
jgi:hypothetical protein